MAIQVIETSVKKHMPSPRVLILYEEQCITCYRCNVRGTNTKPDPSANRQALRTQRPLQTPGQTKCRKDIQWKALTGRTEIRLTCMLKTTNPTMQRTQFYFMKGDNQHIKQNKKNPPPHWRLCRNTWKMYRTARGRASVGNYLTVIDAAYSSKPNETMDINCLLPNLNCTRRGKWKNTPIRVGDPHGSCLTTPQLWHVYWDYCWLAMWLSVVGLPLYIAYSAEDQGMVPCELASLEGRKCCGSGNGNRAW